MLQEVYCGITGSQTFIAFAVHLLSEYTVYDPIIKDQSLTFNCLTHQGNPSARVLVWILASEIRMPPLLEVLECSPGNEHHEADLQLVMFSIVNFLAKPNVSRNHWY